MPKKLLGAWIVVLLSLAGCFYPADRGRMLEEKVEKISADGAELNHEVKADVLPKIDQKINEVTKALNGLDQASRRNGADIGVQLQKTIEDVAQLRGELDSYLHQIQELDAKVQSLQSAAEAKTEGGGAAGGSAKRDADARAELAKLPRPADKQKFFALAESKLKNGDAAVARQLFREFVKKWPRDELAGAAYFETGETYFADNRCEEALPEYGKVVQDYPKSRDAATAYLRSSDCFKQLGKTTEARYALDEILKSYPRSEAAKSAKTKLAELNRKKGGSTKRTANK